MLLLSCVRDLVQNGVVCPGADAELAVLHPHRLLFTVSEMRAANPQPQRRLRQLGKTNFIRTRFQKIKMEKLCWSQSLTALLGFVDVEHINKGLTSARMEFSQSMCLCNKFYY